MLDVLATMGGEAGSDMVRCIVERGGIQLTGELLLTPSDKQRR